jgi:predicted nucleic acid-binding protein
LIADTSAWIVSRRSAGELRERFDASVGDGLVRLTPPVTLELLRGARSAAEHDWTRTRLASLPQVPVRAEDWERAAEVQGRLAAERGGRHRGVAPTDLLIAAVAEGAGMPVLHRDRDFERIAAVTGQPVAWLA